MAQTKVRDYARLASDIQEAVGAENILSAAHCATRLRLVLAQTPDDATTDRISKMPGVIQVVQSGGQYQVVIGTHAKDVYEALAKIATLDEAAAPAVKQSVLDRVIATMSAVFAPFVYLLAGAGLIQGCLIIATVLAPAFAETSTYSVLSLVSWAPFTFLPVLIAVTASKHFKCNTYIAVACCAALCSQGWAEMAAMIADGQHLTFMGIPLAQTTYTSSVLPPLCLVLVLSFLERFLERTVNEVVRPIIVPFVCLVVMVPLTICAIGPASDVVANGIALGYNWLHQTAPALAAIVIGGFWEIAVIFGVHWGVTPMVMANFANYGFDTFQAFQTCAVVGAAAACFGVFLKSRRKDQRSVALSAGITGVFGITEPAIYGVILPLKRPFVFGCIGGAAGALAISFFHSANYAYAGLPSLLTTVNAISPDNPTSFPGMLLGCAVSIVVTVALCLALGIGEEVEGESVAEEAAAGISGTPSIVAPCDGTVVPMEQVDDPMFASKAMGDGVAIEPAGGSFLAPMAGEVVLVSETGHAYGLRGAGGVEMLVHIGLDTVRLGGEGFSAKVAVGDVVDAGHPLCEVDRSVVEREGLAMTTMMVVTDPAGYGLEPVAEGAVEAGAQLVAFVRPELAVEMA